MNRRLFFPVGPLLLVTLACALGPVTATPDGATPGAADAVSTQVAVELTAASLGTATPPETTAPQASPAPALTGSIRLVYSQGGNIFVWDGLGSKQLSSSGKDSSPCISADGAVVAFMRAGELWAVEAGGSGERILVAAAALTTNAGPREPRRFAFAPHSHELYFNTVLTDNPFPVPQEDLWKVDADHPTVQPLLSAKQGGADFVFSSDGAKIALPRADKINIVNADGSGLTTVFSFTPVKMYSEASYTPQIVWLPDASGFKTVIPAADALAEPAALSRFMFVPADGSRAAQLAEFVSAPAAADPPRISPDGSRVFYARPRGGELELHIIDASTADQNFFSYDADKIGILDWAPDSLHVLYWQEDTRRAYLGAPNTQGTPLSDGANAEKVRWIDATQYLYLDGLDLRLRSLGQPSLLIAASVAEGFDVVSLRP